MEAIISISWSPSSIATSDSLNAILCSKVNLHFGRVEAALPRDAVPLGFLVGLGAGGGGGMGRSMGGAFQDGRRACTQVRDAILIQVNFFIFLATVI